MRWIYLSPHFDDAVLSCGGLIFEQTHQGTPVEIWTICAGEPPPGPISPLIQGIHFMWGTSTPEETVRIRTDEDGAAAALLGAETCHFSIPDCIYRRSPQGELLYIEEVFGPRHPLEADLDIQVASTLAEELQKDDVIVCPLTVGGHLDHILTRQAAQRLKRPLRFYADIPYLLNHPEALSPASGGLKSETFPISEKGLAAWQDGIAAYRTQMKMLFETEEAMRTAIPKYWSEIHGISLWH